MTTSKIETLTDEYRILLWDITGQHPANDRADAVAKALRIIDAHAAERAALTEQVAQLRAALENIALGTVHPAELEVARLTEQVAQLTRERDQIKVRLAVSRGCRKVAKAEVARLTEALAAAEKKQSDTERWRGWERDRAEAAEPRMRELEAQLLTARHRHEETRQQLATCTSELAALRERVADARRKLTCPHRSDTIRVKDALEALRG